MIISELVQVHFVKSKHPPHFSAANQSNQLHNLPQSTIRAGVPIHNGLRQTYGWFSVDYDLFDRPAGARDWQSISAVSTVINSQQVASENLPMQSARIKTLVVDSHGQGCRNILYYPLRRSGSEPK